MGLFILSYRITTASLLYILALNLLFFGLYLLLSVATF